THLHLAVAGGTRRVFQLQRHRLGPGHLHHHLRRRHLLSSLLSGLQQRAERRAEHQHFQGEWKRASRHGHLRDVLGNGLLAAMAFTYMCVCKQRRPPISRYTAHSPEQSLDRFLQPAMRRTKEQAEQTRASILAAAEQLFLEKGVAHSTLDQIARAAGVTRGAVYWHFENKAHLFHE